MFKVHHHSYNISGVVDMAVMRSQAERRRDKEEETTVVHDHPKLQHGIPVPCNDKCMVYRPGYGTHSVAEHPAKKGVGVWPTSTQS